MRQHFHICFGELHEWRTYRDGNIKLFGLAFSINSRVSVPACWCERVFLRYTEKESTAMVKRGKFYFGSLPVLHAYAD